MEQNPKKQDYDKLQNAVQVSLSRLCNLRARTGPTRPPSSQAPPAGSAESGSVVRASF